MNGQERDEIKALGEKIDCIDNKIGNLSKVVEKIDQTIHGDEFLGFNGMLCEQKKQKSEIDNIKKLLKPNKFLKDFWEVVKKPTYLLIFFIIISILAFTASAIKFGFFTKLLSLL